MSSPTVTNPDHKLGSSPHPTPAIPHLNIDNISLKSNNNPERIVSTLIVKDLTAALGFRLWALANQNIAKA